MEDRKIGLFWREWFLEKQKDSQASPEDYLIRTYLEWHEKDPLGEEEKRAQIEERIQTWKETRDGFLRMIDRYPDTAGMEEWQAAQMLENVMQELQLDRADASCSRWESRQRQPFGLILKNLMRRRGRTPIWRTRAPFPFCFPRRYP